MAFLLGLPAGLAGEGLLFAERQAFQAEKTFSDDFRVVFFLRAEREKGPRKVLEEKLRAFPAVEDVRYVSPEEALSDLRREDPDLVDALLPLHDNPLEPAFEVRLKDDGLAGFPAWLFQARALSDWSDVRYKAVELAAIIQAQFYERLFNILLSALVCAATLVVIAALWVVVAVPEKLSMKLAERGVWGALDTGIAAAAGALSGILLVMAVENPLKLFSPWWSPPTFGREILVILGSGIAGWLLCGLY